MIDKKNVEHIAKLARIKLTEKEEEKFAKDLSSILDYIDKLNKVDTKNTKPIQQITGLRDVTRKDIATINNQDTKYKILNEAPEIKDNYFKVPKILE
ncbi:MAG TPA: Asp-tRNA(Asn)/Glu-tRNA(Gln) amidotransferase subunit GatC [Candidatus Portnoybacteria bacterium]|jgi:aspartyl-tRNA(Asn)/glutamyl-tRNA(Gln) amidotransferase subunit C|nr:Asp-tRNA(Asn)/Glu-tRNA(Gln) amidotransferase subunit GatC [Candidatus Portnoybacteria bacterium]MDD5752082.1 Asp-tRNA(Asn)/Glu-tRNA(Gln) amidotransferase subunit GatC [Candidatus Portnoybacteria bacterium]HOZ16308.1 Asp-tRNA(Asn)/Glu-tRNA(Gln) amidotransferase subunit GatC [Candidatus Portnoybacteria bacterium]HPH51896.1 Asp-tRNA(Asn)/Glu-tRNA(Gln) amidotransferase subunit GatC [Candidatus Portnoybacteria bacterium]HPJ80491.1 Asp-tRNA(Asn)/Glu-tRNA(Gln) amidotransferase subunit GatC [Candida